MKQIRTILFALAILLAATLSEASLPKKSKSAAGKKEAAVAIEEEQTEVDELFQPKLVADASATAKTDEQGEEASGSASMATTDSLSLEQAASAIDSGMPATDKIDTEKLPEDKIPVLAQAKGTEVKKASGGQYVKLMTTLGVLVLLLGGVCFGLKRWLKNNPKLKQHNKIKIITQHHLGPKKSLAIVRVAGESILIGITDQNISMLKTLSLLDEEIPEETPRNFNRAMDDFDEDEMDEASVVRSQASQNEEEDFTISGLSEIRDSVSTRLKNMKTF